MARKRKLSVLEAVDNLSSLADLDVEKKNETAWLDPKQSKENEERIKQTYQTLNDYLRHLYKRKQSELKTVETQRGIQAMMELAGEAADKVSKYTDIFKAKVEREEAIPEYQQLQQFYLSKIVTRLKEKEKPEDWEAETAAIEETKELGIERQALKDLEAVRRDSEYELFYIHKEDGMPYFNQNVLRHIRLVGQFDETIVPTEIENTLARMDIVLDRDLHVSAKEILEAVSVSLEEFYRQAMKFKGMEWIGTMLKCLMGLMLAANPKNLIHNTTGKHCTDYFKDFQVYLRASLMSDEYKRFLALEEKEAFFQTAIKLLHDLCGSLFFRIGARLDALSNIFRLAEIKEYPTLWGKIIGFDEALRSALRQLPNGPLLKILEAFRTDQEEEGFDPLLQGNPPAQRFALSSGGLDVTFLYLPCPTHQEFIDKAVPVEEFRGYLRDLKNRKHLLFDLQDLTSWKEHSRSESIEKMQKEVHNLVVYTIAKNTEFYHQSADYAELNDAKQFLKQLQEQVASGEQCGFHFPSPLPSEALIDFVYEHFFAGKDTLTRKERLDFIEIFYLFLTLKIIEKERPDCASFSCKDGIDTGAAANGSFFAFASILSSVEIKRDFLIFCLYAPALMVRHRAIDSHRVTRMVSALEHFESEMKKSGSRILKKCAQLFSEIEISKIVLS